jgi:hypothetical protein
VNRAPGAKGGRCNRAIVARWSEVAKLADERLLTCIMFCVGQGSYDYPLGARTLRGSGR